MILVSSCLAGFECNYKGESKPNDIIMNLVKEGKAIYICPEQAGGLTTPRSGARIQKFIDEEIKLVTDDGQDVTNQYIKGAEETLKAAKNFDIKVAILKQGSPSCGCGKTQGGYEKRKLVQGDGITTYYLKNSGIEVYTDEDLDNEKILKKISV